MLVERSRALRAAAARAAHRSSRPTRRSGPCSPATTPTTRPEPVAGHRARSSTALDDLPAVHGRRRRPRQRAARQPAVPPRRADRRRLVGGPGRRWRRRRVRRGASCRRRRELAAEADVVAGSATSRSGTRLPVPDRGRASWLARVAARCCAAARSCCRRLRRRRAPGSSRAGQAAGCAPTAATSAGSTRSTRPGTQDITCDVPLEYLRTRRRVAPASDRARHDAGRVAARASASTSSSPRATRTWQERARTSATSTRVAGRSRGRRGRGAHRSASAARRHTVVRRPARSRAGSHARPVAAPDPHEPTDASSHCSPRDARSRRRPGSRSTRCVTDAEIYDEAERRLRGLLGPPGRRAPRLVRGVAHDPRVGPAVREVVRRRQAQRRRTTASTVTSRPATATRSRTTGRASPATRATITYARAARRREPARQRAQGARRRARATGSTSTWAWCPSCPMALLACARIGAPHSVVFGGFSADSLRDRINDAEAKVLITGDGAWRRGSVVPLKETADAAVADCPIDREGARAAAHRERRPDDRRPRRLVARPRADARRTECPPEPMDTEDLLYLLYTSGHDRRSPRASCTRPAATSRRSRARTSTSSTCSPTPTSTGARPTSAGSPATRTSSTARSRTATTSVMYEGTPDFPDKDRLWQIVEKYGVTILYTAPTAIRTFMKWGDGVPASATTCRRCGCSARVGEPINPEAWVWYWQHIGGERCPVVDTWWQTETGAIMISPLPGRDDAEARAARRSRCPASAPTSSTTRASRSAIPGGGYLVLTRPWPSMLRGIWGDPERYRDDVLGALRRPVLRGRRRQARRRRLLLAARPRRRRHARRPATTSRPPRSSTRSSTTPRSPRPRSSAGPTRRPGQAIAAFVILRAGNEPSDALVAELRDHVGEHDRPDREAEDDPLHRGPAEDPLGQDHAPAAQGRERGPGARRHDDARRPDRRRGHQGAVPRRRPPATRSDARAERRADARALDLARRAGRARAGGGRRHRRRAVRRRRAASTTSRRRAATGERSSTRAATTRSSRRSRCSSTSSIPTCAIVLLTARPERVHHLTEAWLAPLRDPLGPADHAALGRLRAVAATSSRRRCGSCAQLRLRAARSRSRTTAATSRCSAPRASPASTSTPATTTDAPSDDSKRRCSRSARPCCTRRGTCSSRRATSGSSPRGASSSSAGCSSLPVLLVHRAPRAPTWSRTSWSSSVRARRATSSPSSRAYHHGDFSFAYPLARGGGALLAAIGGVLFLVRRALGAVVARDRDRRRRPRVARAPGTSGCVALGWARADRADDRHVHDARRRGRAPHRRAASRTASCSRSASASR